MLKIVLRGGLHLFKAQTASRFSERGIVRVPIDRVRPNPAQPRRQFSQDSIAQLADSIRRHGLLSPILVRALEGVVDFSA